MALEHDLGTRIPRHIEPMRFDTSDMEQWLLFWNDEDTDAGNLRNLEHWLACFGHAATDTRGPDPMY